MITFILKRLLAMIPVLLIVAAITFFLMHMAPGGPWDRDPTARQVDSITQRQLNEYYGLDKPLWRQFMAYVIGDTNSKGVWVCGAVCGNLGPSYRLRGRTVQDILFKPAKDKSFWESQFGFSARLGLLSLSFAILLGIPIGIISALRQNTIFDYVSLLIATIGVSVPNFVIGIMFVIVFGAWLHLVPIIPRSWADISAWMIPAAILGFGVLSRLARLTRASMLEVMRMDYVRTARAKGLSERVVIIRHMLRNSLIPIVTILGPALIGLVTGSFIIEQMFSFPGSGRAYVTAIGQRDYSVIMGTTLLYAALIAFANMTVDIVYGFVDPRIRQGGK